MPLPEAVGQGGIHRKPQVQGQRGAGDEVVGGSQYTQGVHQRTYRRGGIQAEGFVGDDGQAQLVVEVVGDGGDVLILAHQDGDVPHADTPVQELPDLRAQCFEGPAGIVLGRVGLQETHADAAPGLRLGGLLDHVGIGILQREAGLLQLRQVEGIEEVYGPGEEVVVEVYDTGLAAAVGGQGLDLHVAGQGAVPGLERIEDGPVAVPPAVDGLLDVAHYQAVPAL